MIGTVRNAVLTWALDLEERGILGEGIIFSVHEKKVADGAKYSVTNFFGPNARAADLMPQAWLAAQQQTEKVESEAGLGVIHD